MIVPVRCFSCNKVVGEHYEEFKNRVDKGERAEKVLDELGFTRYCCRRMLLSHVDFIQELIRYES
ncbi:MAG: DNA-directed RNA polymerase subunit N [Candidatus Diapherotrites archaeon]|nr:DNA-directed RNA polymerase subunit N [Candidatus Diapherotrites archaeon]